MRKCTSCSKELNGSSYKHTMVPSVSELMIKPFVKRDKTRPKHYELDGVVIREYCNVKCYEEKENISI